VQATTLPKCKVRLYYHLVLHPLLILGYHNWDTLEEEEHMFMPQHKTLNPKIRVGKISFVTIVI
jgi:hypothetical protein